MSEHTAITQELAKAAGEVYDKASANQRKAMYLEYYLEGVRKDARISELTTKLGQEQRKHAKKIAKKRSR